MCKCCEDIEIMRILDNDNPNPYCYHLTKAKLTSISISIKTNKPCGVMDFKAYDLNYCPMCGKKLGGK